MRGALLAAALGLLLLAPAASASAAPASTPSWPPQDDPGQNNMRTSFGSVNVPYAISARDGSAEVLADVRIDARERLEHVFFALNPKSPALRAELVAVEADGFPLPFEKDERDRTEQPRVFVNVTDLPYDSAPVQVRIRVTATHEGRLHLGLIVIGFDDQWRKLTTPAGEVAELYGWGWVTGPPRPPLMGMGNAPGLGPLPLLATAACLALLRRR